MYGKKTKQQDSTERLLQLKTAGNRQRWQQLALNTIQRSTIYKSILKMHINGSHVSSLWNTFLDSGNHSLFTPSKLTAGPFLSESVWKKDTSSASSSPSKLLFWQSLPMGSFGACTGLNIPSVAHMDLGGTGLSDDLGWKIPSWECFLCE